MIVLLPLAGWHTQNLRHAWLQCMEVVRIVHASTVYWGHLSPQLFLMPAATSQYFCGRVSKASSPRSPASGPWPYGVHEPFPAICLVRRTLANIYVAWSRLMTPSCRASPQVLVRTRQSWDQDLLQHVGYDRSDRSKRLREGKARVLPFSMARVEMHAAPGR